MEQNQNTIDAPASDLFQFSFSLTRNIVKLIGVKPIAEMIMREKLDNFFEVDAIGNFRANLHQGDPNTAEYYRKFLEALKALVWNAFGKEYIKNLLSQHYEKIKSWALNAEGIKELDLVIPKFD